MPENDTDIRRFRLDLAYDGRPFEGWQSQVGGNTIQDFLLVALQKTCPTIATVQGSGRTDAGVSAENQVAHFDAPGDWKMGPEEWLKALNSHLPPTIRIFGCSDADNDFHARFSATGKIYRYRIFTGPVLPPLKHGLIWHQPRFRDSGKIQSFSEAVKLFEGTHDFRSFSANRNDGNDQTRDAVRTISTVDLSESDAETLTLTFEGNGFLYKMVRFLVGTGVAHANGKISLEKIEVLLDGKKPTEKAPLCAPADGLILAKVRY